MSSLIIRIINNAKKNHIIKKFKETPLYGLYCKLYYLIFMIFVLFNNKRLIRKYFDAHHIYKLQIGSGMNYIEGWLNTDINPKRGIIYLDACKRFDYDNNSFDYIFNEHFIEHIPYRVGEQFISECYRILRPGGKIRISTPDLKFLIELYGNNKSKEQKEYIRWAADTMFPDDVKGIYIDTFVINLFFYSWGHNFIYDEKVLIHLLDSCGFDNITRYDIGESDDDNLRNLEHHGYIIGEDRNRLEAMTFEATKPIL
jgi:predicted SAM-dependent methyltransferase